MTQRTNHPLRSAGVATLALSTLLLLPGCIAPTPNAGYFALDPAQAEANRQNTLRIQQEDRKYDDAERMSQAHAIEVATRHTGWWWW